MATVYSLTEQKIKELLSGWEGVTLSQEELSVLVAQLASEMTTLDASVIDLNNVVLPTLETSLAENASLLSDLNDNTLVELQAALDQADLRYENLAAVEIPALQQDLSNEIEGARERPKVFVQDEAPPAWDDLEDRDLVVGDVWYDSDDNNTQRIWNGVEWTTFGVDIPDFSLTVRKFLSASHMIY